MELFFEANANSARKLWENLERLSFTMRLSEAAMADRMCLGVSEYSKLRDRCEPVPFNSLASLAQEFDLNIDALFNDGLDFALIQKRYGGDLISLPEQYAKSALSRVKSILTYLDFIERCHGWKFRLQTMRHLGLTEVSLKDPDRPINVKVFSDVTQFLRAKGYMRNDIYRIGTHFREWNRGSLLEKELSITRNALEVYEVLFEELLHVLEKNCRYRIKEVGDQEFKVEVLSLPDALDLLGVKHVGSPDVCSYKAGFFASLPKYIGLPEAQVRELSCAHYGAESCVFEVKLRGGFEAQPLMRSS